MRDPVITIAGREWTVPMLAPRQNRVVVPALMKLGAHPVRKYKDLLDAVFAALTRAHPKLDGAEFEEWPVATWELIDAVPVIARQTGLLKPGARDKQEAGDLPDWDAIIAQFCNLLPGTTPDYWEDALTIPRLEAMNEEWRLRPPVVVLVAGYLGYKPRPRRLEAVEELMRLFPGGTLRLN
jgi:hypothetical protein